METQDMVILYLEEEVRELTQCIENLQDALYEVVLLLAEQHPESKYYLLPLASTIAKTITKGEITQRIKEEVSLLPLFTQNS